MAFDTHIHVRFCETDAVGHVNNVSYYIYFEQARVDFLKNLGLTIGRAPKDINFAVVHTSCDYIKQAYFDQHLIVTTSVSRIGNKSFTLIHNVCDARSGMRIAKGSSVAIIFDSDEASAKVIPDFLKQALQSEKEKSDQSSFSASE